MKLSVNNSITISGSNNVKIHLSKDKSYSVKRSPACKAGEYALTHQDSDGEVFDGYINYSSILENFKF